MMLDVFFVQLRLTGNKGEDSRQQPGLVDVADFPDIVSLTIKFIV